MNTYLSFNKDEYNSNTWRVIHNFQPITRDYPTAQQAIDAVKAVFSKLEIDSKWWNGEEGKFSNEYNGF